MALLEDEQPTTRITMLRPAADPAPAKRRHIGMAAGFVLSVVLPLALTGWYLFAVAADQYA